MRLLRALTSDVSEWARSHCCASLREASHASTSDASQTVVFSPNLKGAGNVPSLTKRQIVAGETGNKP